MIGECGEKRKHLRLVVNKKAKCRFLGDEGSRFNLLSQLNVDVDLVNLSLGGACISCDGGVGANAVKENLLVELEVRVPYLPVTLPGRIIWCSREGPKVKAGIAFEGVTGEDGRKLLEYLSTELRFSRT